MDITQKLQFLGFIFQQKTSFKEAQSVKSSVTNSPAAENALSNLTLVGGVVSRALNNSSRFAVLLLAASKTIISFEMA